MFVEKVREMCKELTTIERRIEIEKRLSTGQKVEEIAEALDVHSSTIYRELKRGARGASCEERRRSYRAEEAQAAWSRATSRKDANHIKARDVVLEWKRLHPGAKAVECQEATGLSKPVVLKWWRADESEDKKERIGADSQGQKTISGVIRVAERKEDRS